MVLDVTVRDQNGKEIFSARNDYSVNDFYFTGGKKVPMAEWDVTATEHFGLGLKPAAPDKKTFIIPVKPDATSVEVEALLTYSYSGETMFTVQKVIRKIGIEEQLP
ncbi:MAG: hypothetical protein C4560_09555 [Nitrospiraceae bacterium]|nr:MAG: hypothetical protein C4560_09555 [Nitrospiraceae bacterium]